MATTKITIELPEELSQKAAIRAAQEGKNLTEVIQNYLQEFIAPSVDADASKIVDQGKQEVALAEVAPPKFRARPFSMTIEEFKKRPLIILTEAEANTDLGVLASMNKLAQEIGQHWPEGVSAEDAIREDRSRLEQ